MNPKLLSLKILNQKNIYKDYKTYSILVKRKKEF